MFTFIFSLKYDLIILQPSIPSWIPIQNWGRRPLICKLFLKALGQIDVQVLCSPMKFEFPFDGSFFAIASQSSKFKTKLFSDSGARPIERASNI